MGGGFQNLDTDVELLTDDGASQNSFRLKYSTKWISFDLKVKKKFSCYQLFYEYFIFSDACTIQLEDWVVVTGGTDRDYKTVSIYDVNGWVEDLPDLNQARDEHGCGYYVDSNNDIVSLWLQN